MYNQAQAYKSTGVNQYLTKEILEATPQQLLIKVYDYAILNCQRNDLAKTNSALQELMNALRFDGDEASKEFSLGLMKLYQFCQEQMRKGNSTVVHGILTELRDGWLEIFSRKN